MKRLLIVLAVITAIALCGALLAACGGDDKNAATTEAADKASTATENDSNAQTTSTTAETEPTTTASEPATEKPTTEAPITEPGTDAPVTEPGTDDPWSPDDPEVSLEPISIPEMPESLDPSLAGTYKIIVPALGESGLDLGVSATLVINEDGTFSTNTSIDFGNMLGGEEVGGLGAINPFGSFILHTSYTGVCGSADKVVYCRNTGVSSRITFNSEEDKNNFITTIELYKNFGAFDDEQYNAIMAMLSDEGSSDAGIFADEDESETKLSSYLLDTADKNAYPYDAYTEFMGQSYRYDEEYNMVSEKMWNSAATNEYRFDKNGNVIYSCDDSFGVKEERNYTYNDNGELIKEDCYNNGELQYAEEYTYDKKGNILSETMIYSDGTKSVTEHKYTYNSDGLIIKDEITYDGEPSSVIENEYHENSALKRKVETSGDYYNETVYTDNGQMIYNKVVMDDEVTETEYGYDEDGFPNYKKVTVNGEVTFEGDPMDEWDIDDEEDDDPFDF